MTLPAIAVLLILLGALIVFATEWLPMDLAALIVLLVLALTGLVEPQAALAAFSNPAVVTIAAMFVLTGGLSRTGVAGIIGRQIDRRSKGGEASLLLWLMVIASFLSAFMNNVGVAALLMPPVIDIARRRGISPARLLMPLSFAALLGGLITLIGTSPNVVLSEQLDAAQPGQGFHMFDFTPIGLAVTAAGIAYMVLIGRRGLPTGKSPGRAASIEEEPSGPYDLTERIFSVRIPAGSALDGLTLAASRLGSALSLNVLAIGRGDELVLAPDALTRLQAGDRLIVRGRQDHFEVARGERHLKLVDDGPGLLALTSQGIGLIEARIAPGAGILGETLVGSRFRQRFGLIVLAIRHGDGQVRPFDFHYEPLQPDDLLLLQGSEAQVARLRSDTNFRDVRPANIEEAAWRFGLADSLFTVRVEAVSPIIGRTLVDLRPESFGLTVLGLLRQGAVALMPEPRYRVQRGDVILVKGRPDQLAIMRSYADLVLEPEAPDLNALETEQVSMMEAALSPHTRLVGKTLRALHFRERFGLSVLAIWREGRALRTRVKDIPLRFGDALLIFGRRSKLTLLAGNPDFILLSEKAQEEPRREKAPLAALIFVGGVIIPTVVWHVPIELSSLAGALAMILTRCLDMEEAYRYVQWRALFLIAGMLPMGLALQSSGAAGMLAGALLKAAGDFGSLGVLAAIYVVGALAAQIMPSPAVALLMGPIALTASAQSGVSSRQLMMVLAVAASSSFFSPVGHPANVLVMGPGGYRFSDFVRVGLPLTLLIMLVALLTVPVFIR